MGKTENNFSPMMRQYLTTKQEYKDCILLYRLGDFYEMFFDDALTASRVLDITLTGRDCGREERAPMCGVPYHAVDAYIAKLINSGYKVAVCEQLEDPSTTKNIVKRGVVRVITAGTAIESEILSEKTNNFLMSLYFNNQNFGVAFCDLSTGEFFTCELKDNQISALEEIMLAFKPSEIICNNQAMGLNDKLKLIVNGTLPKMTVFYDWAYSHNKAVDRIYRQYGVTSLKGFGLEGLLNASSACGALIEYLMQTQKRTLPHLKNIRLIDSGQYMSIDINTRRNLELTNNARDYSRYGSLIWLIDKTNTAMGGRKLTSWINRPLQNYQQIQMRLDATEELSKDFVTRETLFETMRTIRDLERLCTKLSYKTVTPRDLLAIEQSLANAATIKNCLQNAKSKLLQNTSSDIVVDESITELISEAITHDDCPSVIKEGGFINFGFDSELDDYLKIISNSREYLDKLRDKERELTGIKSLKWGYNRVFGYYYEISNSFRDSIPNTYIRKQSLSNCERFITEELKIAEEKILHAKEKAQHLEIRLFNKIVEILTQQIPQIQKTADAFAVIDVLVSFAKTAVQNNYIKPCLNKKDSTLKITEGRHPIVEKFLKGEDFIANCVYLDNQDNRTMILTGPNMAGKSTYMRQVALIVLMAHIGCFVPAKEALIPLTDKIFTRVGASDEISFNHSTFMVEMAEVAYIINNATDKSLIILDEVGRGTSTFDGLSIAWAVVEHISDKIKAKTLFATHYHQLTELEGRLDGVVNFKIAVKEIDGTIVFLRKIIPGGANQSFGIEVARLAGVPQEVTDRAKAILVNLEKNDINKKVFEMQADVKADDAKKLQDKKQTLIYDKIKNININNCTPLVAFDILSNLTALIKED